MTTDTILPSLRLDAEHRYWLGDRELIGVTAALTEAGLIDSRFFTEDAADRGTYIHAACELVDRDDLDFVEPEYDGYVAAYGLFLRDARPNWLHLEHVVYDATLGYAGTADRVGLLNGAWAVLDIKTGPPAPWHGLQLAAYGRLLPGPTGLRPVRYDLYLAETGTYRLEPQRTRTDDATFLAALAVAHFRRAHDYRD